MEYDEITAAISHIDAAYGLLRESTDRFHDLMADQLTNMRNKLNQDRLQIIGGYNTVEDYAAAKS